MSNSLIKRDYMSLCFAFFLCVLAVFGMNSIFNISVIGITLTMYRICIPCLFVLVLLVWASKIKVLGLEKGSHQKRIFMLAAIVFAVWIVYSSVQLVIYGQIDFKEGAKTLLSLILAAMTIFVMAGMSFFGVKTNDYISAMKIIYVAILAIAFMEVTSGFHLPSSKLCEFIDGTIPAREESISILRYMSTSIFYNPNDYAAFVAIMLPLFFIGKSKREYVLNLVVIMLSIAILRIDDAWIAMFSVILAFVVYFIAYKDGEGIIKKKVGQLIAILVSYQWGSMILGIFRKLLTNTLLSLGVLGGDIGTVGKGPKPEANLSEVINAQFGGNGGSSGASRINTYLNSLENMFTETLGLGYGPGNFNAYMDSLGDNIAVLNNPHGLWIEILVEFGVLIFILYVAFIVYLYCTLIRIYIKSKSSIVLTAILIDTAFVFATFAPSAFLGYTYQWIVIGISLIVVMQKDRILVEPNEKVTDNESI